MFFVRTQREHTWQSPKYKLGPAQKLYFGSIMDAAKAELEAGGPDRSASHAEDETEKLSALETAIFKSCIELLNQKQMRHEYEMALVCVSAVLGFRNTEMT